MNIGIGHLEFNDRARNYINDVMDTGRLSYGPYTQKFEQEFARLHDVSYASFCNSGTSALQASIHALKIKYKYRDGDEIIAPALTFVASINTIIQNGLKPVLVDVDSNYYEIDPQKIEAAITPRTKAIMVVHIGGQPCDMDPIMDIAKKYKLQVIEDSCETMFATYKGKKVGSFGDVSCFSTYIAHILTTGVGGLACTNDPELATLIKSLFNHGRDGIYISIDDDNVKDKSLVISRRFRFEHIGYSYRGTEFEGALGLSQLEDWQSNIKKRKDNARYFTEKLKFLEETEDGAILWLPKIRPHTEHVFMFYPILVTPLHDRDALIERLENRGVETRYLLPLTNQPIYKGIFKEEDYPVAQSLNNTAFYIPCHPGLTQKEKDYIIESMFI